MGRSQRALRDHAHRGLRRMDGDQYGIDSRGESHYPGTGQGYAYDWANTWPGTGSAPPAADEEVDP